MDRKIKPIVIGDFSIGPDSDVFLIAEVGNAHDGSYNIAHSYIDAISTSGAHAVKFQTHIASAESTPRERFRVNFSYADHTRFDYWRRMEFSKEQWRDLKNHATKAGLIFLSSPFSIEAMEMLQEIDVPAWKVASGETNNFPLIKKMAQTRKPLLISTGMSYMREIDECVRICRSSRAPFLILHSTTSYPCPPHKAGLNLIREFARRYRCPVGYSDHSGNIYAGIAASVLGVSVLEVHVTLSRDSFGPDVPSSLTPKELESLSSGLKAVRTMVQHHLDKDEMARELQPIRNVFCKSLVFTCDLPSRTILKSSHLTGKKPGDGIPIAQVTKFIGRTLRTDVKKDQQLTLGDLL